MRKLFLVILLFVSLTGRAQTKSDTTVVMQLKDFRKLSTILQELQQPIISDAIRLRIELELKSIRYTMVADTASKKSVKSGKP